MQWYQVIQIVADTLILPALWWIIRVEGRLAELTAQMRILISDFEAKRTLEI